MDEKLTAFLAELATDPGRLAEYSANRAAYLARSGLSARAQRAILDGDPAAIAKMVGGSAWSMNTIRPTGSRPMGKGKKKAKKKAKTAKKKATKKKAKKAKKKAAKKK